jgi:predicted transcriptional regulator
MVLRKSQEALLKNKTVKNILKAVSTEQNPGVTISELSKKTGIERHKLTGMLEILVLLGVVAVFQIGMMKVVAPTEVLRGLIKYII